jgi:peptidase E
MNNKALLFAGGWPAKRKRMLEEIGKALRDTGASSPNIAYIGTASQDDEEFFDNLKKLLLSAGAGSVEMVHLAGMDVDVEKAKTILSESDGIFISGGEVEDGMYWLAFHELKEFLKSLFDNGKLFIGISAGTIMMGAYWARWIEPEDKIPSERFSCLGFVPIVFDTHGEKEGWPDMKKVMALMPENSVGYGLPSNCFIKADSKGNMDIIDGEPIKFTNCGKKGVIIYEKGDIS